MLKTGKTKLKEWKMYTIIEIYKKNEEYWTKIQKHESQFRSKEYDVNGNYLGSRTNGRRNTAKQREKDRIFT